MLYSTLSLGRKTVVIGRYLFALTLEIFCIMITLLCAVVLAGIIGTELIIGETLTVLSVLSCVFSLIVALQYPIYFKYGYTKAKFLALAPMLVIFIGVPMIPAIANLFGVSFSWENILTSVPEDPLFLSILAIIMGIIALMLSCAISCRIYTKKDI